MKTLGKVLLIVGALGFLIGFNIDTTVATGYGDLDNFLRSGVATITLAVNQHLAVPDNEWLPDGFKTICAAFDSLPAGAALRLRVLGEIEEVISNALESLNSKQGKPEQPRKSNAT